MFDTVILMTGPIEEQILAVALRRYNPQLNVCAAKTHAELEAIEPRKLRRARLIGFVSPIVVPARILQGLGYGAYNFHPGPPHFPGWAPSQLAIYEGATEFGATAHVMAEKVDSGPIVAVDLFAIPPQISAEALEAMAFARLARLFWDLAQHLASSPQPLPALPIRWSGCKSTRRRCAELCDVPIGISSDELERRVAAFGDGRLGVVPTITLGASQFRYAGAEPIAAIETRTSVELQPVAAVSA